MLNMPGGPEVVVILLVALIVLGPDQLPKAMRTLGQAIAEIRKVSSGFQTEMRDVMNTIDSTAKETIGTKPSSGASGSKPTAGGQVDEVSARNEAGASSGLNERDSPATGAAGSSPPTSGSSAADRAAG